MRPLRGPRAAFTALAVLGALANTSAGCGPAEDPNTPSACVTEATAPCIVLQRDFAGYESWERIDIGDAPIAGHPTGHRYLRVNRRPPAGATEWPAGTIIVKVIEPSATHMETDLFAMVKRGGDYNGAGARGWEFFTLGLSATGVPVVTARGLNPSNGDTYTDTPGVMGPGCNECHNASAAEHDYLLTPALFLPGAAR